MIKRTFAPGFRIKLHQKDLGLALQGARELGVSLPQTASAAQLMQACAANGMADLDHSALVKALELMADHAVAAEPAQGSMESLERASRAGPPPPKLCADGAMHGMELAGAFGHAVPVTMIELAHLLDQYLAARCLPPSFLERQGNLAFDAGGDVMLCASLSTEGGFELFANPGYLAAWESRAIIERGAQDDEDDGVLLCWEADEAAWSIRADLNTGLVVLVADSRRSPARPGKSWRRAGGHDARNLCQMGRAAATHAPVSAGDCGLLAAGGFSRRRAHAGFDRSAETVRNHCPSNIHSSIEYEQQRPTSRYLGPRTSRRTPLRSTKKRRHPVHEFALRKRSQCLGTSRRDARHRMPRFNRAAQGTRSGETSVPRQPTRRASLDGRVRCPAQGRATANTSTNPGMSCCYSRPALPRPGSLRKTLLDAGCRYLPPAS